MSNDNLDFFKTESPKLEKFFSKISLVLINFSKKHNLLIDKYYHQSPSWNLRFAHPKDGEGYISIIKGIEKDTAIISGVWFIDDYKEFKRYIKTSPYTYVPVEAEVLICYLSKELHRIINWDKDNWTNIATGYEKIWNEITRQEANKRKQELTIPISDDSPLKSEADNNKMIVVCTKCRHENIFDQPYAYHAGFGNQGFLYNDEGNLTLIWDSYDKVYDKLFPKTHPWALKPEQRKKLEDMLLPAPKGGRWRFRNPARCSNCSNLIMSPMLESIYYLKYDGSINIERLEDGFASILTSENGIHGKSA